MSMRSLDVTLIRASQSRSLRWRIPTAHLPLLTSSSMHPQATTRRPQSTTSAFMSQVDQKAALFGIRSKSIPRPRPQVRTGSTSNPISDTPSNEATSSVCTLARPSRNLLVRRQRLRGMGHPASIVGRSCPLGVRSGHFAISG